MQLGEYILKYRKQQNQEVSSQVELSCFLGTNNYTIGLSEDNLFSCDRCNDEMIEILGSLTNNESMDISIEKIKDYFESNNGSCE